MNKIKDESVTRDKLLMAAYGVMSVKGFTATTVDDICKAAGLSKGSFFHYFNDKEQLGRDLTEHGYRLFRQMLESAPFYGKKDALERVFGYIDFLIECTRTPEGRVCLLGILAQEVSETHPNLRVACASCFEDQAARFAQDLKEAKAAHAPRAGWKPLELAQLQIAIFEGAALLGRATQNESTMENSLKHFREYVRYLFRS